MQHAGLMLVAVLGIAGVASGQEPKLSQFGRANRNLGMDDTTFNRLFAQAFRERRPDTVISTNVEQLADQVVELRVFLTVERDMVVGEIAISGRARLRDVTLQLEQGAVTFSDRGQAPDRRAGDGVFTARFRMSTELEWRARQPALAAVAQEPGAEGRRYVRRGPRDIVPAREALDSLRRQAPATFRALSEGRERARRAAAATTFADAARVTQFDIARRPVLSLPVPIPEPPIPGPGFEPPERFRFPRMFDIPILDFFPPPAPVVIDPARSLMIVHPDVVDNPGRTFDPCTGAGTKGGPWSFGHLMREMSHGTGMTPEDYTLHWLSTWILAQEANGFIVLDAARGMAVQTRIIDSWRRLSGAVTLDVDQFPARLLAIVNRPDLADKIGYGSAGSAGEGRFVFGLMEKPTPTASCFPLRFTVIFEYGIAGGSCPAVKAWHQRWKDLDMFALGSSQYNAALEQITRDFTDHGSNPSQFPNQSALNQLRTNEIALGSPWQLREFRLQSNGAVPPGGLDLVTVKQTPDDGFRNGTTGTPVVGAYIVANETDILNGRHIVPERFPGLFNPFMGAKSEVESPPDQVFWNAPGLTIPPMTTDPAEARRIFSLSTCNGCHGGETATVFTHIGSGGTRSPGTAAILSRFLTGFDMTPVPVFGGTHHYEDLAERQAAMSTILTTSCFGLLGVRRIPFVH